MGGLLGLMWRGGIAAILVVIGHSIQVADPLFDKYILFRLIYSFHMPLFMFLSGFVSYKSNRVGYNWLVERAKNLAIPFIVWTILPALFSGNTEDVVQRIHGALKQPDVSFWFLIILFYCNMLLFVQMYIEQGLCKKIYRNLNSDTSVIHQIYGGICSILIVFFIKFISHRHPGYGMNLLAWHVLFFFTGYWVRRLRISLKVQKSIYFIFACLWLPLVASWSRVELPNYVLSYATQMSSLQFEILASSYNYVVAFAGIGFSVLVSMFLSNIETMRKVLSKVGIFTVEIYLMQGLFFNIIRTPYIFLNIICNVLIGGTMPIVICYLMEHGRMKRLLFGKKQSALCKYAV